MITVRKSEDRGHFDHGWLNTYHSFSFDRYIDREWMGFHALRVINEDWISPGTEFPTHPHRDMEIVTYVLKGALTHKDSMGNGSDIVLGEIQRMSAGSGITHSESNNSDSEAVHLLQIWIHPESKGMTPSYEQRSFSEQEKRDKLCLIASRDGRSGSVVIHQDCDVYASILGKGIAVSFAPAPDRAQWLQVISGVLELNGAVLQAGDGAACEGETNLRALGRETSEFIFFDMSDDKQR